MSEVHRFEFARRNDDRGGAVKMCFQMLPPFFLGGVKMYLSTNLLFLLAIDMSFVVTVLHCRDISGDLTQDGR